MIDKREITYDILMADMMLRLTALEKLLLDKGVVTKEELIAVSEEIAKKAAKMVMEKAQSSKDINEFVANLASAPKSNN